MNQFVFNALYANVFVCGDHGGDAMMVPNTRAVYVHSDVCGAVGGAV